jgi:hypothetical protein
MAADAMLRAMDHQQFWQDIRGAQVSAPCARMIDGLEETIEFVLFVAAVVTTADEVRTIAATALANTAGPEEADETQKALEDASKKQTTDQLRSYRRLIFQMLVSRSVDHYLAFVSGLLAEIFASRPETLRSGEQVRIDFVLGHESMDELVGALAERRVDRLAYQGLRELAADLRDKLHLDLFRDSSDLARAERMVEDRNLIVHNHAIVNAHYLRKIQDSSVPLGSPLDFDFDEVFEDITFLAECALQADGTACTKWGIPQATTIESARA